MNASGGDAEVLGERSDVTGDDVSGGDVSGGDLPELVGRIEPKDPKVAFGGAVTFQVEIDELQGIYDPDLFTF